MSLEPYPTDVSDAEWAFLAPHLTLMREDAPQRVHTLRELLNACATLFGRAALGG